MFRDVEETMAMPPGCKSPRLLRAKTLAYEFPFVRVRIPAEVPRNMTAYCGEGAA